MPRLQLQALITGDLEEVWEHVTACSATGRVDRKELRERYGRLMAQDGDSYTFIEEAGDEKGENQTQESRLTWRYTFDRPNRRLSQAQGSRWSDRWDYFETVPGGTMWTIIWEPKGDGLQSCAQWLMFQWRTKSRVYRETVQPVLNHFQASGP